MCHSALCLTILQSYRHFEWHQTTAKGTSRTLPLSVASWAGSVTENGVEPTV